MILEHQESRCNCWTAPLLGCPHSATRTNWISFNCLSLRMEEAMDTRRTHHSLARRAMERFLYSLNMAFYPSILCLRVQWKDFGFDETNGECAKNSLLRVYAVGGEKFYSMHSLVQEWIFNTACVIKDRRSKYNQPSKSPSTSREPSLKIHHMHMHMHLDNSP